MELTQSSDPRQGARQVCEVLARSVPAPDHVRLTLRSSHIAASARAGHFVHILCRDSWESRDPLLRRAFSVMSVQDSEFQVLFRVGGPGTAWLSRVDVGEELDVLGPLGLPFRLEGQSSLILVGGGVGIPPMVAIAEQVSRETPDREVQVIVGARSASGILGVEEFRAVGVAPRVVTEDGTSGVQGRVTAPLQTLLQEMGYTTSSALTASPAPVEVCCCGPLPMLRAVAELCAGLGVPCQVSLEENMPCGVGVCNGCVVAVLPGPVSAGGATQNPGAGAYEKYRRICVEGPVMSGSEVDWEATCR